MHPIIFILLIVFLVILCGCMISDVRKARKELEETLKQCKKDIKDSK